MPYTSDRVTTHLGLPNHVAATDSVVLDNRFVEKALAMDDSDRSGGGAFDGFKTIVGIKNGVILGACIYAVAFLVVYLVFQ